LLICTVFSIGLPAYYLNYDDNLPLPFVVYCIEASKDQY